MTSRAIVLLLVLAAAPATSFAGELRLGLGGGAAAVGYDPCSYDGSCSTPRTTTSGAAPMVLAGYRGRIALRHGWALRVGGILQAVLVAPGADTNASVATGAGELGIERGRIAADIHAGLSRVRMSTDQMSGTGATMMMGGTLSAKLSPELALFGRVDLHAMMHGTVAAAFIGVGLEWTP